MKKDKFVIRAIENEETQAAFLYKRTLDKLREIKKDSNIPMCQLVALMVDFCAERLEVIKPPQADE